MSGTPSTPYNRRPPLRRATPRQRGYLPTSSIPANAMPVIPPMQLFRLDPNNNPEGAPPIQGPPIQGPPRQGNNNGNTNGGRRSYRRKTHKRKTHRRKTHRRKTHRRKTHRR